jgi:hemoglobin-like flavoprotein
MGLGINPEPILQSLELVVERIGDPTPQVYERLFAAQPEMEALFVMDKDYSARGHMLSESLTAIIDFVGDRQYADNLMRSEIMNHEGMGVPPNVFATFFAVIRDTFRETLGADWSDEMEKSWSVLLEEISDTIPVHA